jgi:bacterioferritin (cytochrome b1)
MENTLKKIVASDNFCGRFLNTLSCMEYVGARKIIKNQAQQQINKKILTHMHEEMRHALVLKKAALRVLPDLCASYAPEALLAGEAAYQYFQAVDHAAPSVLQEQDPWRCYLYTTFLIEVRVLVFYAAFDRVLIEAEKAPVFRGILAEEEKHLEDVSQELKTIPDYEKNIAQLNAVEAQAFDAFLERVRAEIV